MLRKKFGIALIVLMAALSVLPVSAQEPVIIRWLVGLGTGVNPPQVPPQEQIVADFNASRSDIQIEVQFVETGASIDTLSTLIASGNAPDIVGPVGVQGSQAFADAYLDLTPLIESSGFDLSQYNPEAVDFYRVEGEGLLGLPYAVYPSFIGYNADLFDEAGLNYPPDAFGAPYVMPDGTEVEWNFDTLAEIGRMLTVDANGYAANEPEFDPTAIVQYGYSPQFASAQGIGTLFGAGTVVAEDGSAQIPDSWREAFAWVHDGIFGEQPFIPSEPVTATDEWGTGNPFSTGKIAMMNMHVWYITCCLGEVVKNWDTGAMPTYNGTITAKLHADNFRILETTEHPEEAFEVLQYLTIERGAELLQVYGGMPALAADQPAFFDVFTEAYPNINQELITDALSYVDVPSHEGNMPNFAESNARLDQFSSLFRSTPDLDLDEALATLQSDLQAIFDRAAES